MTYEISETELSGYLDPLVNSISTDPEFGLRILPLFRVQEALKPLIDNAVAEVGEYVRQDILDQARRYVEAGGWLETQLEGVQERVLAAPGYEM